MKTLDDRDAIPTVRIPAQTIFHGELVDVDDEPTRPYQRGFWELSGAALVQPPIREISPAYSWVARALARISHRQVGGR